MRGLWRIFAAAHKIPPADVPRAGMGWQLSDYALHPGREEFRQGAQELLRLFEVRDVPGAFDFHELPVRKLLDGGTAERRPVAERPDILRLGVPAKEAMCHKPT